MLIVVNARVVTPHQVLDPGWVAVEEGRIAGVGRGDPPARSGAVLHDLGGRFVLPGFIDLHMHGGGGAQITTDDQEEILTAVAFHRRHGTTSTLASLVTDQIDRMAASVSAIAEIIRSGDTSRGRIVGVHLEGPFLNPAKKGSHHAEHLLAPDRAALRHLLTAGDGTVRVVTLAPELPGGMDLLREVTEAGVIAAVGHTEADYDQARDAFASGARLATHLFNAMRHFHHRDPGPAGAALADENVVCELINDGVHVHDEAVRMAMSAAGSDRVAFVTDATPAAGMTSGRYHLGPVPVFADEGTVKLSDGTLAGSTLTMDATVRHAVRDIGISIVDAAIAAATTPAHLLGISDRTGAIQPGKDADLVVLDGALRVSAVMAGGEVVHGSLTAA
ncbi:N-acetylglucosamine-6-phosphate deacetylase [Streptosporangium becharense]|uniref:N-acetylglucosamine-6-phosphate deacetylase n=1 Tax=Streptosporangium becharense TaxID=1816182 RepID=A0A7W9IMD5_9ACTN|nr:N-acetylglucosamine-6-phosphate deacetylase [Streptosporangium becharense]MBB2910518.1 N-acetylglucosamine-6-phosphate deacetylase [Streptosporangium becharense]MBB5823261.1 N-acetylglucosamine-6-phosphate deacetylase [Streptosporangium becharense]